MNKNITISLCLVLGLILVCSVAAGEAKAFAVDNIVTFGSYEQDAILDNGKEPITWIVLDVNGKQALLLSAYGLDARPYNTDFVKMTWAKSTLRAWLNDTFLQEAFSPDEIEKIILKAVINADNPYYGTYGGVDTQDQIFLLSIDEVFAYLPTEASRIAQPTAYAIKQGAYVNETNGNTWWWLRSPGDRPIDAEGVRADGRVTGYGSRDVYRTSGTIRPAMWVDFGE